MTTSFDFRAPLQWRCAGCGLEVTARGWLRFDVKRHPVVALAARCPSLLCGRWHFEVVTL